MMKCVGKDRSKYFEKGFTFIELLLVVAVLAAVTLSITQIFESIAQRIANQRLAQQMLDVQRAAETYVAVNFDTIVTTDIPGVNDIGEITLATLKTDGFLNTNFNERNRFGQNITVFVRNLGASFANGETVEVLAVSENPASGTPTYIPNNRLREIAKFGGAKLGFSSELITTGQITSSAAEWQVGRNAFETAGYDITPSANDGGYLASYGRIAVTDALNDDILYKVALSTSADANVMQANLDMNDNQLLNVASLAVDRMEVAGDTNVIGNGEVSNAFNVSQMVQFSGDVAVNHTAAGAGVTPDDDCTLSGGSVVSTSGTNSVNCTVTGGNVTLDFDGQAVSLTGDLTFEPSTLAGATYNAAMVTEELNVNGTGDTAVVFTSAQFEDVNILGTSGNISEFGSVTGVSMTMNNPTSLSDTSGANNVRVNSGNFQMVGDDPTNPAFTRQFANINTASVVAVTTEILNGQVSVNDFLVTTVFDVLGDLTVSGNTTSTDTLVVESKRSCTLESNGDPC